MNTAGAQATGKFTTVTAPLFTVTDWANFNGRAPSTGGVYQRIYRPVTVSHDSPVRFTHAYAYSTIPSNLSTEGYDLPSLTSPVFTTTRTDPTCQGFAWTVFPSVLGPRGFAVGYTNNDIKLQVFSPTGIRTYSRRDYGDIEGCQIVFNVGEQVKIVPMVVGDTTADNFMRSYFASQPERLYEITAVDTSASGEIRYTINNAHWPATVRDKLRFYMIRPYATWDQVPAAEIWWQPDNGGVPAADLGSLPYSDADKAGFPVDVGDEQKTYKNTLYYASSYDHRYHKLEGFIQVAGPSGLPLYTQNTTEPRYTYYNLRFSSVSRSVTASETTGPDDGDGFDRWTAWLAPVPDDYEPRYMVGTPTIEPTNYDSATQITTVNVLDRDELDQNMQGPIRPVRIARSILAPLLESDNGNFFFGYNPPFTTFENRQDGPPGRYYTLRINIIQP